MWNICKYKYDKSKIKCSSFKTICQLCTCMAKSINIICSFNLKKYMVWTIHKHINQPCVTRCVKNINITVHLPLNKWSDDHKVKLFNQIKKWNSAGSLEVVVNQNSLKRLGDIHTNSWVWVSPSTAATHRQIQPIMGYNCSIIIPESGTMMTASCQS